MNRKTAKPRMKTKIPGPNTKKWVKFHLKNAAEATYEKHFVWDRKAPAIGPFCTDPDGNIYLDFASHVASSALGYNHPKLTKLAQELAKINPDRYAGTDFIGAYGKNPKTAKLPTPSHLHAKLTQITKKLGFTKSFLVNSGAEAIENAMKLCYAKRKNYGYAICFNKAFHGRTLGALSLNSSKKIHTQWHPKLPKVISIPFRAGALKKLLTSKTSKIKPKDVAFVIIEPIQGEGGYNFPTPEFMQEVEKITKKYRIPLICDEIQTGMGRSGKWWACEHFNIKPDIIAAGKALKVGAAIGKAEFFPKEPGRIGSTWGEGNAIASALGYATIEIIQKEKLLINAKEMGKYFLNELKKIAAAPAKSAAQTKAIKDVRGLGLLLAIELKTAKQRDKLQKDFLQKGLITLSCGTKTIRLLPPLNVTKREINLALEILNKCLKN